MGHTNKLKQYKHTKYKSGLNIKTLGPTGLYELVLVAVHMETSDVQPKCQGPLQLLSPPFLMTSTTKQVQPNGRGGVGSACAVVIRLAPAKPCAHCRAGCWATSVQSVEHDLTAIYKSVWLTAGDQRPWRAQQTHPPSSVGDINN